MSADAGQLRTAGAPERGARSIRTFVTDGSLAALCDSIGELAGCGVRLRDERGVVLDPWKQAAPRGEAPPVPAGATRIPLIVDGERIGELTIEPENDEDRARVEGVRPIVEMLAHVASELCTDVVELRHRVMEVRVLSRLSAKLADGGRESDALRLALDSALEALDLHAGNVVLLPEDADGLISTDNEEDLQLSASRGLSDAWLNDPMPLSRGRLFDRSALAGEVVTSEDLLEDDRTMMPERTRREGLRGFLSTGLLFSGRPLGVMRVYSRVPRVFSASDRRFLRSIGQQAAAAVEQARLLRLQERERVVQRSLQVAGAIQKRMLSQRAPALAGLDVAARYVPSYELGGDFYDLFDFNGRLGVVVGDVVGKGVPASLLMSSARATLRAHAETTDDLGEVMRRVNVAMCRDTDQQEFATIWLGAIDPATFEMSYVSAGHDPPALVRKGDGGVWGVTRLRSSGMVVGVLAGETYEAQRVQLRAGDVVVAYTDGLIDARGFDGQRLGRDGFESVIRESAEDTEGESAEVLVDRVVWGVRRRVGLTPQVDDETIAAVRVTG